ncbi:hypothetical protein [Dysgonomonas alginatilytica]|nr:hypothetical protein [Dysgonomonas alginatilytica]
MNKNNQITLSKSSSTSEIKAYFQKVLQLSQLEESFPINLDEVWMLVYSGKNEAVRSLRVNFIENIDYQVFSKNAENSKGGRPTTFYLLSVSCLEYFIARKIRPVFEVYRKVFHKAAKQPKAIKPRYEDYDKTIRRAYEMYQDSILRHLRENEFFTDNNAVILHQWDENYSYKWNICQMITSYHDNSMKTFKAVNRMLLAELENRRLNDLLKKQHLACKKYAREMFLLFEREG